MSRRWTADPARDRPLVLAHRGDSAHALENTIPAFRRAREVGADGVELDAIRCRTGEIVVFHDDDLVRLAGRREAVRDLPLSSLRQVVLPGGERIPTLDEVLEELGPELLVNIELKARGSVPWAGARLAPSVAAVIRRHALAPRVVVSSFHPGALARFRMVLPQVRTGLLCASDQRRPLREGWARTALRPYAIHPEAPLVRAPSVARWRAAGLAVHVWTVDEPPEVRRLAALGVDALITNDVRRTLEVLAATRGAGEPA